MSNNMAIFVINYVVTCAHKVLSILISSSLHVRTGRMCVFTVVA